MNVDKNMIREKISSEGCDSVTDAELVGLFTGNDSIGYVPKGTMMDNVGRKEIKELMVVFGLTKNQAVSIKAAVEIGKRVFFSGQDEKVRLTSPTETAAYLMPRIGTKPTEEFLVLCLNTKNRLIGSQTVAQGSLSCAIVHPREVFSVAIMNRAASIIVAHNHPSGEPAPSDEDKELTKALVASGNMLGIPVNDHIIIGQGRYYSFKESGSHYLR